ncbi:MAG: UDP-N-acetylmuramoyl-L-alanine--D-glutamate ligase [Bacilli bacterium]|nr:UDP-N-acetylmuramoyl-L-alanine--D-glutamate ligase [Bacilli bacterium]
MFKNKKIFVLGMARSGYEVAKLLSKYNNKIIVTDKKEQDINHIEELEELGVSFIQSEDPINLLDSSFDLVIKNPGIRYDHPLILKAIDMGIKVVNEVEVAYHFLPNDAYVIAVTGANGKTTTTTLVYEFIKAMGKRVHLGGNIGYPLSQIVEDIKPNDIVVLEISAQQLHDCYDFNPNVSILTNLVPVHIDFFGTYENYIDHKLRIFMNHNSKDIAIINKSNKDSYESTKNINSNKIYFSSSEDADCFIKDSAIYYKDKKIINLNEIRVKGMHNYENIMCAIIATKELGISNETIKEVLNKFTGVEHRIEFVAKINGREFYNDSKATNVKSTEIALNAFNTPTILLLGGLDRGHSFDDLKDDLSYVTHIVSYGETKNRIKEFADSCKVNCTVVDTLEEATKFAYNISNEGDTILLSPACASWDQFDDFEKRGEKFKETVKGLE